MNYKGKLYMSDLSIVVLRVMSFSGVYFQYWHWRFPPVCSSIPDLHIHLLPLIVSYCHTHTVPRIFIIAFSEFLLLYYNTLPPPPKAFPFFASFPLPLLLWLPPTPSFYPSSLSLLSLFLLSVTLLSGMAEYLLPSQLAVPFLPSPPLAAPLLFPYSWFKQST